MFICRLPEVSPLKLLKDNWKSGNGVGLEVYMCILKGRGGGDVVNLRKVLTEIRIVYI